MVFKRFLSVIVALAMMFTLVIPTAVSSEETDEIPETEVADMINVASEEPDDPEAAEDNDAEDPANETPANETPADEVPADETPADETPADETPADEPSADETSADETPADGTPADETPAEETAGDETSADGNPADEGSGEETPVEEGQDTETVFENGYVMVSAGTDVYRDANKNNRIGAFNGDSVVYAVMAVKTDSIEYSWLKINFDTEAAREAGEPVVTGYVQFKSVAVLSEEEALQLTEKLVAADAREFDGQLMPIASFEEDQAEEMTVEEEPTEEEPADPEEEPADSEEEPEEEELEDEEVETDASVSITAQPEDVTVPAGATATFTVAATGNGLTYQWQYRTSERASWVNTVLNGNKTAELSFVTEARFNKRQYRCIVKDANGNTLESTPAILTVFWTKTVDGVIYQQIDADTCKVVGYTGTAASLTIPTTVDGKEVREIGEEAFMGNTTLTSICLPNTITAIRARAFKNCTNLSSMTTH